MISIYMVEILPITFLPIDYFPLIFDMNTCLKIGIAFVILIQDKNMIGYINFSNREQDYPF